MVIVNSISTNSNMAEQVYYHFDQLLAFNCQPTPNTVLEWLLDTGYFEKGDTVRFFTDDRDYWAYQWDGDKFVSI